MFPTIKDIRMRYEKSYQITVHNSKSDSHNINITHPTFYCNAISEAEAIGKMHQSNFRDKIYPIYKIDIIAESILSHNC